MTAEEADPALKPATAFDGERRIAQGPLYQVALAVKVAEQKGADGPLLIYDDASGKVIDVDLRGTGEQIVARLSQPQTRPAQPAKSKAQTSPRGPGRPKLGVVAREVTLLPRHWQWLSTQSGGASVALRKLVEEARRKNAGSDSARETREAAYRFLSAMAGDLPGFEEASRALFANDRAKFAARIALWPKDIKEHAMKMAFGANP